MNPLVSIENLTKIFAPNDPPAISQLSAAIPKGEIIGLVGPDGAGKTTLIRLMAGLLLPTQGSITVAGLDTIRDAHQLSEVIGYMPQKFGLYEDLTVMQNLTLYADLRALPPSQRHATFERLLHFTALAPFTDRLAGKLSGGMKQKLGLACALIVKPTFLLLDEPSVGVDPISRLELWKMVDELLQEGISVLWSTSYLEEAQKCHRVLLLNSGKLLFYGTPAELKGGKEVSFERAIIERLGGLPQVVSELARSTPPLPSYTQPVIVADALTKKFGDFTAADHISFTIRQGEIFGLLGPNGAGKSTTFKMLCGLLKPTSGKALVKGLDLEVAPGQARAQIGYMAQKFSLYGDLSVKQNLEFFSGIYNLAGRRQQEAVDKMIEVFDLAHYLDTSASELPLGFKQRLALSCATMHHPAVLFLDEPTSGVDPLTRFEFWSHIKGLVKKGVTIMVTTHFMNEAENCDRIALIYRSKMIRTGTPEELQRLAQSAKNPRPTLEDAFIQLIKEYDALHPY